MSRKYYTEKLSARQRLFCQYVAEGVNPSLAAIKAGYSERGNRSRACRLMKRAEIRAEIRRLQEEMASPRIMTLQKRKERLSEIIRACLTDYFEVVNGDIRWKVNKEKVPTDGIFKIKTVTKTDKFGTTVTATSITLGNTIKAIHELNKMEGLY
jgi:phage terminase small subunit